MDLIVVIAAGQFAQKNAVSHLLTDQQVNNHILKKFIFIFELDLGIMLYGLHRRNFKKSLKPSIKGIQDKNSIA